MIWSAVRFRMRSPRRPNSSVSAPADDLPELPDAWLDALRDERPVIDRSDLGAESLDIVRSALTEG